MNENRKIFIGSSFYGMNYVQVEPARYFSEPAIYLEAQKRFHDRYPVDFVSLPVNLAGEYVQYGAEIQYKQMTGPIVKRTPYERWGKVKPLDRYDGGSEFYTYMVAVTEGLKANFAGKPLVAIFNSPVDYGIMLYGMDRWLDMLMFERDRFFNELEGYIRVHQGYKQAMCAAGADLMVMGNVLLNNRIVPDWLIQQEILPFLEDRISDSPPMLIHSTFMPIEESVKNLNRLKPVSGYVFSESDRPEQLVEKVDPDQILVGNFGSETIYKRTPDTIETRTLSVLRQMADWKHFILGTAGSDLSLKTSEDQLQAIFRGVKRYEEECGIG